MVWWDIDECASESTGHMAQGVLLVSCDPWCSTMGDFASLFGVASRMMARYKTLIDGQGTFTLHV